MSRDLAYFLVNGGAKGKIFRGNFPEEGERDYTVVFVNPQSEFAPRVTYPPTISVRFHGVRDNSLTIDGKIVHKTDYLARHLRDECVRDSKKIK